MTSRWTLLTDSYWTSDRVDAWDNPHTNLLNMMFRSADLVLGGLKEVAAGFTFIGMNYKPLAFPSGVFRG